MTAKGENPGPVVLSAIITNWNTRDLLRNLLRSIHEHRPPFSFEVIVVDNGSADESPAMIAAEFPWVQRIQNDRNLGYARANNIGFASAKGEFVLLLGSDTVLVDNSMERMVEYLRSHPDTGAVSCRLLNPDRTVQGSCRHFPTLMDGVLTYLSLHRMAPKYNMEGFDSNRTQEVEQPAATCLMLRRGTIAAVGLFDERFSILYNDVELCMRVWQAGWKIVYLAEVEVIHHGSQSTKRASPELRLEMYRNILLYYRTYVHPLSGWILRPILAARLALATRSLIGLRLIGRESTKGTS
ncbi:MAG: putative glycosyltransferase [Bacteroidetes bacterium]|nr:putative glycosyltransferase [Bacteroidota bacterium]